jgi:hypothetical protein
VYFTSQGDRIAWTQIEQMVDGKYNKVGYYDYFTNNLSWLGGEKWIGEWAFYVIYTYLWSIFASIHPFRLPEENFGSIPARAHTKT